MEEALDQEMLTAAGLGTGSYALTIDDQPVGTFPAEALAHGINLARMPTPMLRQSQTLAWETEHRNELERRLFMLQEGNKLEAAPTGDAAQQAMQSAVTSSTAQQQKGRAAGRTSFHVESCEVGNFTST